MAVEKPKKQNGGKRPGSGRKAGGKNKATVLRETKAAEVIARTIDSGKPLAVEVLQKMMEFAEGAVAAFKPTLASEVETLKALGQGPNADGNVEEFGRWFDRWLRVAEQLAKYQSPQIKAMDKPTAPPKPGENRRQFTLRVFEGGRQVSGPIVKDESAA